MDEQEKARNYFQLLLETTLNNNHLDVGTIHSYLGRIARDDYLLDEALSHHYTALRIREEYLMLYHTDLAASHNSLGLDYFYKKNYRLALCHLQRAVDIEMTLHGKEDHTNVSKIIGHIALVHQYCGDFELVIKYFQHALNIEQRLLPSQHVYIGFRFENIGSCYMHQGEYQLALQYYQEALGIVERTLPIYHRYHAIILKGIINSLDCLGNYKQAIEYAIRKLDIDQALYKGWTMARLSELFLKLKDRSKSYQYFQDALAFYEKNQSSNSSAIFELRKRLKQLERSFLSN